MNNDIIFTQEQIKSLIKVKSFLVENGFDIHCPKQSRHPEEVIAVLPNKNIAVELSFGRDGAIFINYYENEYDTLKQLIEKSTGVKLFNSLFRGRTWTEDVKGAPDTSITAKTHGRWAWLATS